MADAMVENRPAVRFFCHRCNMEFEDVLQDYTCPYCASGFIEQLENGAERVSIPGQTFSDANMSNIDDTNNIDEAFLNSTDRSIFPLNNVPPVLRDIAFLMSGGRLRGATRQQPLIGEMEIGFTLSGGRGAAPPGTVTAGAPLVLLGPPGDYVFGGEALDAVVTQLLGQLEHSGPPPMPRDVLDAIPSASVTEQQAAANMSCSVCWDNFQLGETVSKLECEHMFHSHCITPWLQLHATCPICRRSLLPPDHQSDAPAASTTSPTAASTTNTSSTTSTTNSSTTAASTANGEVPRPDLTPRVVIRRSSHPLFRRAFQTHTWDSPRDMSTSSDSSSSMSVGGLWAPPAHDSGTNSSTSTTSVNDRTQNYHTDFDCD